METQNNSTTKRTIVSAKEARERSVTSKLSQLETTIADVVERAISEGRTEATVSVAAYSETVVSKAVANVREAGHKVTTNRSSINLAKNFANTITISWSE